MELKIEHLSKAYKNKLALDDLSARLTPGLYGLLGPNGAGKTTLIHLMTGLLSKTGGEIFYDNTNVNQLGLDFVGKLGYLPQYPKFYKNFRAEDFLQYMGVMKGMDKQALPETVAHMLELVNLSAHAKQKIGQFSGGMRQRLGIAQAMLNNPEILLLDEPTAGLDPKERIRFRNLISVCSEERIVILATHIVSDVEYAAKEVLLLREGKLIAQASPEALLEALKEVVWLVEAKKDALESYMQRFTISNAQYKNGAYTLRIVSQERPCEGAVPTEPNLEDVYLYYFGETCQ